MKVLWLTNILVPDLAMALGQVPSHRGSWVPTLAKVLVESGRVKLSIATNVPGAVWRKERIQDVQYYAIPMPKSKVDGRRLPPSLIQDYQRVVEDFQPDVIHIHGTEYYHGLLTGRGYLKCSTVISIQGIIDAYQRHYWGNISLGKLLTTRTLRDWVCVDGLIEQRIKWIKRAKWEREIFVANSAFIGRTLWDRAHTRRLNPKAHYYHCDELIRQPFYDAQWDISKINRHSIFASNASYPIKGFHVLVKAAAILRREFPDIIIRTPLARFYPDLSGLKRFWKNRRSTGYDRYLTDLIRNDRLEKQIIPLPDLDARGMTEEFRKSHAFVLPSLIENSPNSLAEAMLVGTPSVASSVGGVPSMAKDSESVLFFSSGDEAVLAEQIRHIFLDDDLACRLSVRARNMARARHSKDKIVSDILGIYERITLPTSTDCDTSLHPFLDDEIVRNI